MGNATQPLKLGIEIKQRLFFRFSHPLSPTILFGLIAAALWGGAFVLESRSWGLGLLLIILGILTWTFIEYLLHRFIFHLVQIKEPWRSVASGLHMAHHRDTELKELILAPPVVSLMFSGVIFLIFWGLTGSISSAMLLLAGVSLGYIAYEWCHYGVHQYQFKFPLWRYLKHYHLIHHFKNPNGTFGVTSPFWDVVFRTTYRPKRR